MKKGIFILGVLVLTWAISLSAQTKVVAHRGYWDTEGSAQNSLTALRKAAEVGCWGSEFDVWMTADGEVVVFHDSTLGEGYDRPIVEMTAAEVCAHTLPNGERVPTLAEYLCEGLKYPDLHLVLELKPHPSQAQEAEAVAKCVKMIEQMGLAERTDYISFSLEACREFHRLAPSAKVFYLNNNLSPKELKAEGFAGPDYHFAIYLLHPRWLSQSRRLGLETNVWTVNSESVMRKFIRKGVDYLTTNRPEEALRLTLIR
ncbi:MAG: glycerophosphodiester phosphodiesterase [Tidjanibacter sp.]|nr:glycerophosphodiester phosphodiesterase [Tidjanibacter sp.]